MIAVYIRLGQLLDHSHNGLEANSCLKKDYTIHFILLFVQKHHIQSYLISSKSLRLAVLFQIIDYQ